MLGPKGLDGGIRVESLTDFPERFAVGVPLWLDGTDEPMRITRVESGGRSLVLYLDGIATRDAAQGISGRYLEAPARALPEGEFYWDQLIGLEVMAQTGEPIGELVEIFRAGGNEVYRVVGAGGERLIPALRSTVLAIDLDAGRMTVAADDSEEVR